jgi:hypothetical protein
LKLVWTFGRFKLVSNQFQTGFKQVSNLFQNLFKPVSNWFQTGFEPVSKPVSNSLKKGFKTGFKPALSAEGAQLFARQTVCTAIGALARLLYHRAHPLLHFVQRVTSLRRIFHVHAV